LSIVHFSLRPAGRLRLLTPNNTKSKKTSTFIQKSKKNQQEYLTFTREKNYHYMRILLGLFKIFSDHFTAQENVIFLTNKN